MYRAVCSAGLLTLSLGCNTFKGFCWCCTAHVVLSWLILLVGLQVDKKELTGRTLLPVPGYKDKVEFGVLVSFAYKIDGSGAWAHREKNVLGKDTSCCWSNTLKFLSLCVCQMKRWLWPRLVLRLCSETRLSPSTLMTPGISTWREKWCNIPSVTARCQSSLTALWTWALEQVGVGRGNTSCLLGLLWISNHNKLLCQAAFPHYGCCLFSSSLPLVPLCATFCSGAVKITPAHDHNDYEVGERHNLAFINILDENGLLINVPPPFLV